MSRSTVVVFAARSTNGDRHIQDDTEHSQAAIGLRADGPTVQVHLYRRQALRRDEEETDRSAVAGKLPQR